MPAGARYRPDVDGLRALAVVPVVLFHAGLGGFPGGYVGVDVFFVISGYVITASILHDQSTGSFTIARFYERRTRRIFPALIATIVATSIAVYSVFLPPDADDFFRSVVATSTFTANLYFWLNSGYFAVEAQFRPLLHTWSLAVEEQYYLLIPLIFVVGAKHFRSQLVPIFVLGAVLSLGVSAVGAFKAPTATFFVLPTRAWELLCGALVALAAVPVPTRRAVREVLSIVGLLAIGYAVHFFDENTIFPGLNALFPCLGAVAIILAGSNGTSTLSRALSSPPFVFVGKISYSLYLVHWPLIVFVKYVGFGEMGAGTAVATIAAAFALAVLSWKFVEQPFRVAAIPRPGLVVAGGAMSLAAVAAAASLGIATHGFAGRYPDFDVKNARAAQEAAWRPGTCFLIPPQSSADWSAAACGFGHQKRSVLLWGDSFAAQYLPALAARQDQLAATVLVYSMAACPPVLAPFHRRPGGCAAFNSNALDLIRKHNVDTVVMAARWSAHPDIVDGIRSTTTELARRGLKVYLVGQSPTFPFDVYALDYRLRRHGLQAATWPSLVPDGYNQRLQREIPDVVVVDPMAELCTGARCSLRSDGALLYADSAHLSEAGATFALDRYFPFGNAARVR